MSVSDDVLTVILALFGPDRIQFHCCRVTKGLQVLESQSTPGASYIHLDLNMCHGYKETNNRMIGYPEIQ